MKKYRLRIGLDVDDTLYECNAYALELLRRRYGDVDGLSVDDINRWGALGDVRDERLAYFGDPDFVRAQPLYAGAQELVRRLVQFADVFFVTAVPPACMSARAERLRADFPEVPVDNILIGTRKDIVNLDILLDDAAHNIAASTATYPVLMRRPWNNDLSGLLSVNSFDDFVHLAETIANSFVAPPPALSTGGVICLVGPAGTGKTALVEALVERQVAYKPLTATTRAPLPHEDASAYRFVSRERFIAERRQGKFIETTVYGTHFYGTTADSFAAVDDGKIAVLPIDICGAVTMKNRYRERALLVFCRRDKRRILESILSRPAPDDEKINRLLSLDCELRNAELCDVAVDVDEGIERCVDVILRHAAVAQ